MAPMTFSGFQTTMWTQIREAKEGRPEAVEAIVGKYRPAILSFIRQQGYTEADAEDFCQEVFARVVANRVLEKAEAARGRFRSLLLAVTRHTLQDQTRRRTSQKRGGSQGAVSLDQPLDDETRLGEILSRPEDDPAFDAEWVVNLVRLALGRLRELNSMYADLIEAFTASDGAYETVAAKMRMSERQVKNALYQARLRLNALVREEIAAYASSSNEFDAEIACLSRYLK